MQTPSEFVTSYALIGQKKAKSPATKLLVLGVLAGFLIGMGAAVTNTAGHALTNPSVAKIVSGLLFPFGLIMVILTPNSSPGTASSPSPSWRRRST